MENFQNNEKVKLPEPLGGFLFHLPKEDGSLKICTEKNTTDEDLEQAYNKGLIPDFKIYLQRLRFINRRDQEEIKMLRIKSVTDKLTNIPNLEKRDQILERVINNLKLINDPEHANKSGVILFQIDLKGLKSFNLEGQEAGNKALINFASLLSETIRNNDFIFRIGGDEFMAVVEINEKGQVGTALDSTIESIIQRVVNNLKDVAYIGYSIARKNENNNLIIEGQPTEEKMSTAKISEILIKTADDMMTENKKMEKKLNSQL